MRSGSRALLVLLAALAGLSASSRVAAQQLFDAPVRYDFADFRGAGFVPTPMAGQLDSDEWIVFGLSDGDMRFGETRDTGDFARGVGDGDTMAGGVYAFLDIPIGDVGREYDLLGVQPTGSDLTPGGLLLRMTNDTGGSLEDIVINYVVVYRNDQDRATDCFLTVARLGPTGDVLDSFEATSFRVTTPLDAGPGVWTAAPVGGAVDMRSLGVAHGDDFGLIFNFADAGGMGSRDQLGIAAIRVAQMLPDGGLPDGSDGRSDAGPVDAGGPSDAGSDAGDAGLIDGRDAGRDAGPVDAGPTDAGPRDAGSEDAATGTDAGPGGTDGGPVSEDAGGVGMDAAVAVDASMDAGTDAARDSGAFDAGTTRRRDPGCGCRSAGGGDGFTALLLLAAFGLRRRKP